jgi:hypothetical protein
MRSITSDFETISEFVWSWSKTKTCVEIFLGWRTGVLVRIFTEMLRTVRSVSAIVGPSLEDWRALSCLISIHDGHYSHCTWIVFTDPCLVKYCGKGRECQVSRGVAECVCQRRCRRHQKLVCGTDGQLYANHCELHRTACLDDRAIAVDHTYDCMKRRAPPGEWDWNCMCCV